LKTITLFAAIGALWFLGTHVGFAETGDTLTAVPEPASLSLLAGGVAATIYAVWRRRK
jgi:hypothetical protein